MNKNRKRGVSFIEIVISVALMLIIMTIIGPVLRYYLKAGEKTRYGITATGEQSDSYYRMEEVMASLVIAQSDEFQQGKKTKGVGYSSDSLATIQNLTLNGLRTGVLDSNSNAGKFKTGTVLFVEMPNIIMHGTPEKSELGQSFHYFRFGNDAKGNKKLFYRNTLKADGTGNYITSGGTVFTGTEETLFPSPLSKTKIKSGLFKEVAAGTVMIMEYCDGSKDEQCDTKNTGITRVEKLFLKRGEI